MDGWVRFPDVPAKRMGINTSFSNMTTWIAALFVAVQVLVSFPVSHDHHDREPECDCPHCPGHFHASEQHLDHSQCPACQLLGNLGVTEQLAEITSNIHFVVTSLVRQIVSFQPDRSKSARAPPVELM